MSPLILVMGVVILLLAWVCLFQRGIIKIAEYVARERLAMSLQYEALLEEAHETIEWYEKGASPTQTNLFVSWDSSDANVSMDAGEDG